MNITRSDRPGIVLLKLAGKFDIEQTEHFQQTFNDMPDKGVTFGIDMSELNFIDSSGMGTLIKTLNQVKNAGGQMILFGLKPMILNVFKLAKLDNFFKVMPAAEFDRAYPAD